MTAITLNFPSILALTDEQFYQLCQANADLRLERTNEGELIIMPPTGGETGHRNIEIAFQIQAWSRQNNLGIAFDSSTGFKLPNGAERSPDASWVRRDRWEALSAEQKRKFLPLSPDFVVELRSESDSLTKLQAKMQEYLDNGTQLGWLIDPQTQQVEIYRSGREVEILQNPSTLSGEDILQNFELNLKPIFTNV
ncbi:Uma2 family endonuclease [Microcoleus sp. FACHB-68]|uniref:Uma2 family endonuclease n=1 Tax=Microcoleus sp. FACHB-68 TaxID=2692826 RepID=UPI0016831BB9|nr:Uma2 family endonuclease [Microcoleus sp. FACHB-68]MBD1937359.1 Uma2 family endonuclease [Microcoleus sp. FACHB-68]